MPKSKSKGSLNMLINPNPMFNKSPKWKGFVESYRKCRGTGKIPRSFGSGIIKSGSPSLSSDWDFSLSTSPWNVVRSVIGDFTGVLMALEGTKFLVNNEHIFIQPPTQGSRKLFYAYESLGRRLIFIGLYRCHIITVLSRLQRHVRCESHWISEY